MIAPGFERLENLVSQDAVGLFVSGNLLLEGGKLAIAGGGVELCFEFLDLWPKSGPAATRKSAAGSD